MKRIKHRCRSCQATHWYQPVDARCCNCHKPGMVRPVVAGGMIDVIAGAVGDNQPKQRELFEEVL